MGDRANIVVDTRSHISCDPERIFMYGHYAGETYIETAQQALDKAQSRWNDPAYLARIIFNHLTRFDPTGLTGYGLAGHAPDNEHPLLLIEPLFQRVAFVNHESHLSPDREGGTLEPEQLRFPMMFIDFVQADIERLSAAVEGAAHA